MAMESKAGGLEGVVVADTVMSDVDGERGRLTVRGYDVESIAPGHTFEDVWALLHTGALPDAAGRERVRATLADARVRAFSLVNDLLPALTRDDGMDALRASLSQLSPAGSDAETHALLAGATAVYAAAWWRTRGSTRLPLVAPDASLSHAADYLRMVTGANADPARIAALDAYLVTVADHGMNASTFAARVVASTGSDPVSAIVAAVGALKGPLHGGAPGPVLDMLDAIGRPERAEVWLESELSAGRRIMGMGHRVYRVRDPRAAVLERALGMLGNTGGGRLELARAVERAAVGALRARHAARPLHANVEFYTAVLLDAVGLPRELFSPTFAVGRVAGWTAHFDEQRATGRLIRPASRYVGPAPARAVADEREAT